MHHHTKFHYKKFNSSEYIVWTNSNPIFSQDTQTYNDFGCKSTSSEL